MRKYQILKILEPFSDDIEIEGFEDKGSYDYQFRAFYKMTPDGEGKIILSRNMPEGKVVEMKI